MTTRHAGKVLTLVACLGLLAGCAPQQTAGMGSMDRQAAEESAAETTPPFSGPANVGYASVLWKRLEEARLVGPRAIQPKPYQGQEPHGAVLTTMESTLTVGGHEGAVWVKNNHVGEGVSIEAVSNAPYRFLDSVTVMYEREEGYDPDNDNWFWAKYNPNGSLQTNPKGMKLAGRVAKGANVGCIACHTAAPGGDFIYTHDRGG